MTSLSCGLNAWLFLNEDEPPQTNYNSPDSCFQTLIRYRTYDSAEFIGIAFFEVVDAATGCSIGIGASPHPEGLTNQDYLDYVLRDARQINPGIKFLATMVYGGSNTLAKVFANGGDPQTQANAFAANLLAYLQANGMNGIDIDWEGDVSEQLTQSQFQILFSTIRQVFDAQPVKYYLSFTPAWPTSTIDYPTVNSAFDFVSPQFYDGMPLSKFLGAGISPARIGYGAQFEPGNAAPNTSAQQVWNAVSAGFTQGGTTYGYQDIFMWRLNSGNYQFEQAQFMILGQLARQPAGNSFDDSAIIGAAGHPALTALTICSGDVLDALQATYTGTTSFNTGPNDANLYTLLQHGGNGGNGGNAEALTLPQNDPIVGIAGYTGVWYGWQCVLQLTLTGKSGKTYGPFGTMAGSSGQTPFTQTAPAGQSVFAFSGTTLTVALAGGNPTSIIGSLNALFG
jgi:hypothetical protein